MADVGGIAAAPFTGGATLAVPMAVGGIRGAQSGGLGGAVGGLTGGTAVAGLGSLIPGASPFGATGVFGNGVVGPGITSAAGSGNLMSPSTAWNGMNFMGTPSPTGLSSLKDTMGVMGASNLAGNILGANQPPQGMMQLPQAPAMPMPNASNLHSGPGSVGYLY